VAQGTVFGSRGCLKEAIECFNRAIEIDPNITDAWYNKGIALINQENLTGALECMQKAAGLDPDFTVAWFKMGSLYRRLGNYITESGLRDRESIPSFTRNSANSG
jgi:tetratricopeptide (TPR) repeat protein